MRSLSLSLGVLSLYLLSGLPAEKCAAQFLPTSVSTRIDAKVLPPEEWIAKPIDEWPQIVLTNAAEFDGHTPLKGASAFLVQNDSREVFAATAKHLLGDAGGVKPTIPPELLETKLIWWNLHPRSSMAKILQIAGEYPRKSSPPGNDLLLLRVKEFTELPSYPLHVRRTPIVLKEDVYLLGCPYSNTDGKQKVYSGKVISVEKDGYFAYQIRPPVDLAGFSGAPIIDSKGHLVGICTIWFQRQIHNGQDLIGGGESTVPLVEIIDSSN